jgi:hypothetical protein
LPGRPWLWNSSASWSVKVGRPPRPSFLEDISTPYNIFTGAAGEPRSPIECPPFDGSHEAVTAAPRAIMLARIEARPQRQVV